MTESRKPRVALIGTGGTISSIGRDSLDVWEYMDTGKKVGPDELLARVPEMAQVAEIVPVPFQSVGSTAIGPAEWLLLTETIHDVAAREAPLDGVVITHGTATLEETAYFLNLAVHDDVTVVVVGAQRPASGLSSDAAMNLVSAVRVAAAPEARGLGVLVVLNDEIQAAREVTKASTLRLETFRSADLGMLGYADPDGRVAIYRRPARRHAPDTEFDVRGRRDLPRVDIAYSYAGADGTAIDAFVAAGARAIVVASHGARRDDRRGDRGPAPRAQAGRAGRAVEPGRERARAAAHDAARARLRRRRQPPAPEGAHPRHAGPHPDGRSGRGASDVRRVLTSTASIRASIGALRRREPPRGSSPARRRPGRDALARCPGRSDVG